MISNENNLKFRNRLELKRAHSLSECNTGYNIIVTLIIISIITSLLPFKKENIHEEQRNLTLNTTNHTLTTNNNSQTNTQMNTTTTTTTHVLDKYYLNNNVTQIELLSEFDNTLLLKLPSTTCILLPEAKITIKHSTFSVKCIELTSIENISLDFSIQLSLAQIKGYNVHLYTFANYTNIKTHLYNDIYKYNNNIRICSETFQQVKPVVNNYRIILEVIWNQQQQHSFCFDKFNLI
jgi:hypothetical protein